MNEHNEPIPVFDDSDRQNSTITMKKPTFSPIAATILTITISLALTATTATAAAATPPSGQQTQQQEQEQACPKIHIFAARETTTPPGFGSARTLVDLLAHAFPGATTAEAIIYPAAGGTNYSTSVAAGIAAVLKQTAQFTARCPESVVVMHGYSQVCFFIITLPYSGQGYIPSWGVGARADVCLCLST